MRWFYQIIYRYFRAPWDIGPRAELVALVDSGRLQPCRAIDLGSGTASNAIFLAQHGFDVTGIDFAESAIALGRKRAQAAGVNATFVVDDLTRLRHVTGTFDLLVDYGTLDDLSPKDRDAYVRNVLPLAHVGSRFLIYCFEWPPRWWERPFYSRLALDVGEVERRFGAQFDIERIVQRKVNYAQFPPGEAVYLMTRRVVPVAARAVVRYL